jgi:class 3 adenylate cyclase/tetratricopeptide (TPR) repeat protein
MVADRANAERRIVTTLFADLAGSTALAARLDPEELDALLSRFFSAMEAVIARHGGVVEKYIGDAIVAYFGAHRAFGDDATRAVNAALAMQRRLEALRREDPAAYDTLRMRIGIESGEVLVTPGRETERLATGQSLNVAARIQTAAEEGAVLVGERAARQVAGAVAFGEARSIAAKGVSEPLIVRAALDEAPATRGATPFVGREAAVDRLRDRVAAVGRGAGGIITVAGSRGSGRSRVVDEARRDLAPDVTWLEARGRELGSAPGYALFVDLLRSWLGLDPDASAVSAAEIAGPLAEGTTADLADDVAPALAVLLDPAATPAMLPGDVVGRQVFRAMRTLIAGLSANRPVVIVADDLDAVDDDSLRLLAHVASLTDGHPVMVVAVVPSVPTGLLADTLAEWRRAGRLEGGELTLEPLIVSEARELVTTLIPDASHEVIEAVVRRGSGEPYLLEQLAAAVVAAGGDVAETVPDTIRGALQARIDTLDENVKRRLRAAAVFSGDVTAEVLEALLGDASHSELLTLVDLGLLVAAPGASGTYRFADPLLQDVAYGTVPKARRTEWHGRAAHWLERHDPDVLTVLAFHYAGAGDETRARHALVRAGDQAGSIAADATALRHYRAALDAAGSAGWDPIERSSLERKIGEALLRRGAYDQARSHFERGLEVIGDRYPASPAEIRRRSRAGLASILIPVRSRRSDPEARRSASERARLYARLGWVDYFSDGDRFFLDAVRTVHFGTGVGDAAIFETVQGLMGVGVGLDVNGNGRLAARFHRRALQTAEAASDPFALGFAHLGNCVHEHHVTGDWDAALDHARKGMTAFASVDASHEWGSIAYLEAWILAGRGGFARALAVCDEMLSTAHQTGDGHLAAWATEAVGRICLLAGAPGRAVDLLSHAAQPLAAIPDNMNWARARAEAVQARAMLGDIDVAGSDLEATERFVQVHDVRGFYRSELTIARARLALVIGGDTDGPPIDAAAAVVAAGEAAADDWEGRVEVHRLAADLAARRDQPTAVLKELDRAAQAARRLGSPLHEAMVDRDRWRLTGDSSVLATLAPSFSALGLVFDPESGDIRPGSDLDASIDAVVSRALPDSGRSVPT